MLDALALAAGLALLTVAADRFVDGAVRLSRALRVSAVVIGALVIGFGTSAPELVVTLLAAAQDAGDLGYGNLVGSNSANALLVLGVAALVAPLAVSWSTLRREVPLMLAGVAALAAATLDGRVGAVEGAALLAGGVGASWLVLRWARADRRAEPSPAHRESLWRPAALSAAGLIGTIVGAQLLVHGAVGLARSLGVSEAVIGLTVVAVGTSLPELVTAVAGARRGHGDVVIGNVLGSNLFNSLPVAGVAALAADVELGAGFGRGVAVMVAACAVAAALLATGRRVGRVEGAALLALFAAGTAWTAL